MEANKATVKSIQILSTLSILMILVLHSYNYHQSSAFKSISFIIENFLSNGLTRIAVPVFFAISGYLYFYNKLITPSFFIKQLFKRIYSIGIPFVLWSTIGFLLFTLIQLIPFVNEYYNNFNIKQIGFSDILELIFIYPLPYQLWFLQILLLCSLISPLLWLLVKQKKLSLFTLVLLTITWFMYGGYNGIREYFFEGIFFFMLGAFFALYPIKKLAIRVEFFILLFLILLALKTYLIVLSISFYAHIIGKISILIGLPIIWKISTLSKIHNRALLKISKYNFWIFLSHEPLLTFIKKFLFIVIPNNEFTNLTIYIIAPCIALLLSVCLSKIISTKLPSLYSILIGGRSTNNINKHA